MKPIAGLSILVLIMILPGCFPVNQLEFDGLKPAEVAIPNAVRNLTVVARCDLDLSYKESLLASGRKKDFNRDSIFAKQTVLGCSDALLESPRFELFNPVVKRTLGDAYSDTSEKLPWDMILMIAGDTVCDAVLALEVGQVNDTISRHSQDGWISYSYVIFVRTVWRLYRLSDFQSSEYTFTDTIRFYIDPPQVSPLTSDEKIECIREAMYESGVRTAKRLAPWWTVVDRYFFSYGPAGFSEASAFLRQGKWQEAAAIWRPMTESGNKQVAAKASFNMALTCEFANNFPAAFDWLRKSEKLGIPIQYVNDYQAKLARRDLETAKLDLQLK